MNVDDGQGLMPNYFLREGKVDYQAVQQYARCLRTFLGNTEAAVYDFLIDASARFGDSQAFLREEDFLEGRGATEQYKGIMPLIGIGRNALYRALRTLEEYGLLAKQGLVYTLRFLTTPLTITSHEQARKGFYKRNAHNSKLRTEEGLMECALRATQSLIQMLSFSKSSETVSGSSQSTDKTTVENTDTPEKRKTCGRTSNTSAPGSSEQAGYCPTKSGWEQVVSVWNAPRTRQAILSASGLSGAFTPINPYLKRVSRYSDTIDIYTKSPDKSGDIWGWVMSQADKILQSITSKVENNRQRVRDKRKKRRSLADLATMFEQSWTAGQKSGGFAAPSRIVTRADRHLLKQQIIVPFREGDHDPAAFAAWVTKHWEAIGAQHFTKAKSYPERPAFRWLIACLDRYVEAYAFREHLVEDGKVSRERLVNVERMERIEAEANAYKDKVSKSAAAMQREMQAMSKELIELRAKLGMALDDDPVYDRIIKDVRAKRIDTSNLPKWDDAPEEKPRRIVRRKKK